MFCAVNSNLIAGGAFLGELINIDNWFERFEVWLRDKTGNQGDSGFVDAFLTASLTVCVGAMAIIGVIQDGISGDHNTLLHCMQKQHCSDICIYVINLLLIQSHIFLF